MKRSMALATGLILTLAACQDTAGPGGQLSRAEAIRLAAAVITTSESAVTASVSAQVDAQQGQHSLLMGGPPTTFTRTHQSSHPCPSGGALNVAFVLEGSVDTETGSLEADLTGSHTHASCAFPSDAITITVSGDPSLAFEASVAVEGGLPSEPYTFSVDGAFNWTASDGRSGRCELVIDAVTNFNAKQRVVDASICGHTVHQTTTWS